MLDSYSIGAESSNHPATDNNSVSQFRLAYIDMAHYAVFLKEKPPYSDSLASDIALIGDLNAKEIANTIFLGHGRLTTALEQSEAATKLRQLEILGLKAELKQFVSEVRPASFRNSRPAPQPKIKTRKIALKPLAAVVVMALLIFFWLYASEGSGSSPHSEKTQNEELAL